MDMIGLMPHEVNEMRVHFEAAIRSPDSQRVTIKYRRVAVSGESADPIYGENAGGVHQAEVKLERVPCLQHIIQPEDLVTWPPGIVQIGWCLFYFSEELNLQEPVQGKIPIPDTMTFVDAKDKVWEPKKHENGPSENSLIFMLGDRQIGQPILCLPKV